MYDFPLPNGRGKKKRGPATKKKMRKLRASKERSRLEARPPRDEARHGAIKATDHVPSWARDEA